MEKAELIERLKGRLGRTARGGDQVDAGPSDLVSDQADLKPGRLVTDQARLGQEDLSTAQATGPPGSLSTAQGTRPSGKLVTDQAGLEPERLITDQAPVSVELDDVEWNRGGWSLTKPGRGRRTCPLHKLSDRRPGSLSTEEEREARRTAGRVSGFDVRERHARRAHFLGKLKEGRNWKLGGITFGQPDH